MISASRPVINPISVLNPSHGKASIEITADDPHPGEYKASYSLMYRILAAPDDGYYPDIVQVFKSHEVVQTWDSDSQSVKTTCDETNVSVYHDRIVRELRNSVSTTGTPGGGARYLSFMKEEELTVYVCFVKEDANQLILITSAGQGGSTSPQRQILDGRPGESVSYPISAHPDPGYSFVSWYSHDEVDNVNLEQTTIRGTIPNAGTGLIWAIASFRYDGPTPRPPYPPPDPDPDPPPPVTKFIVTISASPQAGGVVSGGGEYDSGATCTLSASRNVGYELMRLENAADGITVYPPNPPQCFGKTITHSFAVTKDSSWIAYFRACTNAILRGKSGKILRGQGGDILRDW